MKCSSCKGLGYLEESFMKDAGIYSSILQCKECKDVSSYSKEISRRYKMRQQILLNTDNSELCVGDKIAKNKIKEDTKEVSEVSNVLPFRKR